MTLDYNRIQSLSDAEFEELKMDVDQIKQDPSYLKVSVEVLEKVERILDVKPGTLHGIEGYIKKQECSHCGKTISLDDKVLTALVDAGHSKSFILHTMIGNKRTTSRTPFDRCSSCGTVMHNEKGRSFWGFIYCTF